MFIFYPSRLSWQLTRGRCTLRRCRAGELFLVWRLSRVYTNQGSANLTCNGDTKGHNKHLNEDTKGHNKTSVTSREANTKDLQIVASSQIILSWIISTSCKTFFNCLALSMVFMSTWSLLCLIKREFKIRCYHTLFNCDQWGFLTEEQNLIDQNLTVICQGCIDNITV